MCIPGLRTASYTATVRLTAGRPAGRPSERCSRPLLDAVPPASPIPLHHSVPVFHWWAHSEQYHIQYRVVVLFPSSSKWSVIAYLPILNYFPFGNRIPTVHQTHAAINARTHNSRLSSKQVGGAPDNTFIRFPIRNSTRFPSRFP
jgi:hypothetical protein